ncbi:MAG: hypothetical protein ABIH11_04085, partial [Candidatus Altiarchaeota archaeon]
MRIDPAITIVLTLMLLTGVAIIEASGREEATKGHAGNGTQEAADLSNGTGGDETPYVEPEITLPECISDLDCGENKLRVTCHNDFVVEEFYVHECLNPGTPEAECVENTRREFLEWCDDGLMCAEGKRRCIPEETCSDNIKNQGETETDCGGPCEPCGSCNNGVKDKGEEKTDCGGTCPSCEIQCTRDESCGISHWTERYCGEDGHVYRDYITYECVKPGRYGSYCKTDRQIQMNNYCGPVNICVEGTCMDPRNARIGWRPVKKGLLRRAKDLVYGEETVGQPGRET